MSLFQNGARSSFVHPNPKRLLFFAEMTVQLTNKFRTHSKLDFSIINFLWRFINAAWYEHEYALSQGSNL